MCISVLSVMGQLITVTEKPSARHGIVRFETNRALTGMGHERYRSLADTEGVRPPDLLARGLFENGGVKGVHIHGNVITVELASGGNTEGMETVIKDLFTHYRPGVMPSIV